VAQEPSVFLPLQGLAVYAFLSFVLFRINNTIRGQVALKQQCRARPLLLAGLVAAVQVPLVLLVLAGQDLAGNLVLDGSRRPAKASAGGHTL
jgi:hypothetical protein